MSEPAFLRLKRFSLSALKYRQYHRSQCIQCNTKAEKDEEFLGATTHRVFSGIQPTGVPHLGNYVSAIRQWVTMQEKYDNIILSIVDLHSITVPQDPIQLRKNIYIMAACLLACGINPEKTILFQQSTVPHHTQLSWILGCLCSLPRLAHLPQWKEKSLKANDQRIGLYTYPILQAADILLYKSTTIPVGEDQITHLELARDLAKAFNRTYGVVFPQCVPHIGSVPKLKSLKDPSVKMSKSDANPASRIELSDSTDDVIRKLTKAQTDGVSREITYNLSTRPGLANLIQIHAALKDCIVEDIVNDIQLNGLSKKGYKEHLAEVVNTNIQPINKEMKRLLENLDYLDEVLKQGTARACEIADGTMQEVNKLVGLR